MKNSKFEIRNSKLLKGFTLLELLVVISIISILIALGAVSYATAQKKARDSKRMADAAAIGKVLEQYYSVNSTYALATTFSCTGGAYWPFNNATWGANGTATGCPASVGNALSTYFAGSIPRDPYCSGTSCSSSWNDYAIENSNSDGLSYMVCARLENAPTSPCTCPYGTYNYCVKSQQ